MKEAAMIEAEMEEMNDQEDCQAWNVIISQIKTFTSLK